MCDEDTIWQGKDEGAATEMIWAYAGMAYLHDLFAPSLYLENLSKGYFCEYISNSQILHDVKMCY